MSSASSSGWQKSSHKLSSAKLNFSLLCLKRWHSEVLQRSVNTPSLRWRPAIWRTICATLLDVYCAVDLAALHFMDASWGCHGTPGAGKSAVPPLDSQSLPAFFPNRTQRSRLLHQNPCWASTDVTELVFICTEGKTSRDNCSDLLRQWHLNVSWFDSKYRWVQTNVNIVNTLKQLNRPISCYNAWLSINNYSVWRTTWTLSSQCWGHISLW